MPNWGEPSGSKGSFSDPSDYEHEEEAMCERDPSGPRPWAHDSKSPSKASTSPLRPSKALAPQAAPKVACTHTWRACVGKFGAYFWCRDCNKTKGIYTHRAGVLIEDNSLEWLAMRNDDLAAKRQALELANVSSRSKRTNNR